MIGLYFGIGAAVFVLFWAVIVYNKLNKKKLSIENNFSQIKIQCKNRFYLIPNLIETVRSHAKQNDRGFEKAIAT
jgi:LemA protein